MIKPKIPISLPSVGDEEWFSMKDSIKSGWLTQGPKVAEFEKKFAENHQVKFAIATTSCTTGLHLILTAMGIKEGDEVIVPAFTWIATANVVLYCGATPVFVDVDPATNNLDPSKLASKISDKTKAIIVVHLFGLCVDVDTIRKYVPSRVKIIEDAACAVGAKLKKRAAGGLGDAAAFSFHPRKIITTGEGGMITTNDQKLAELLIKLRNHGAEISEELRHLGPKPYILSNFNLLGFNYRMTDLQGSIGLVQLEKLEQFLSERQRWARYYFESLATLKWLKLPIIPDSGRHGWQSFVVQVLPEKAPLSRNQIMDLLQSKGIATRPGTHAVHMLDYYVDNFGFYPEDFPGAKQCNDYSMAIPLHNCMSQDDYEYVVDTIRNIG